MKLKMSFAKEQPFCLSRNVLSVQWYCRSMQHLTHCSLVMPYGDIKLGQHWYRWWLVAWWHQAITWTKTTIHQWCLVELTWEQFHRNWSRYLFLTGVWKLQFKNTATFAWSQWFSSDPGNRWHEMVKVSSQKNKIKQRTEYSQLTMTLIVVVLTCRESSCPDGEISFSAWHV